MSTNYKRVSNRVPISGGQPVEIEAGDPWQSAYRGSRYSLVTDGDFQGTTLKWEHRGLAVYGEVPSGLHDVTERAGK